jgi:hypothetical protein
MQTLNKPLIKTTSYEGSINVASALDIFQNTGIEFVSVNNTILVDNKKSRSDSRLVEVGRSSFVGGTRQVNGVMRSLIGLDEGISLNDLETLPFVQAFDIEAGVLKYHTYYDSTIPISIITRSSGSANYSSYNGSFQIAANVGTVVIPYGTTVEFGYGGNVSKFSPPSYAPTANFKVRLTPFNIPSITQLSNFRPQFWKIIGVNGQSVTKYTGVGTYDFVSQTYMGSGSPGLDAFVVVAWGDSSTINVSHYLVAVNVPKTIPDRQYVLNTEAGSRVSLTLSTHVLVSLVILDCNMITMPLVDGSVHRHGGYSITLHSPASITIKVEDADGSGIDPPTLAWATSTECGRVYPAKKQHLNT